MSIFRRCNSYCTNLSGAVQDEGINAGTTNASRSLETPLNETPKLIWKQNINKKLTEFVS